jgi:hydrogenase maturation factor
MALVVDPGSAGEALRALEQAGQRASVIGEVVAGEGVAFR